MYVGLLTAAEPEVAQFGIGLRIDSAKTVDLVKRVQFTPGGSYAQLAANVKPAEENVLAGLPAGPFVVTVGGEVPQGLMERMMKASVQMMQSNPMFKFTPAQAEKYAQLSTGALQGLRYMRLLMGVAEPGTGLYENTTTVMIVDDSKAFLDRYEKSLTAMHEFRKTSKVLASRSQPSSALRSTTWRCSSSRWTFRTSSNSLRLVRPTRKR